MTDEQPDENENQTLYRLFLGFSRRLNFFIRHLPSPLGTNGSHVMVEIYEAGSASAKEIAAKLNIEKSILSRVLTSLEAQGLVEWSISSKDRRWKELRLTQSGEKLLQGDCAVRNRQTAIAVTGLNVDEVEFLRQGQRHIAEALNSPPVGSTLGDNPLELELRRITRAFKFLGHDFMQTGLPAERCQVLLLIAEAEGGLPMVELKQELGYEESVLSRLLSSMAREGLLKKVNSVDDHRQIRLSLTEKGRTLHNDCAEKGGAFVRKALFSFGSERNTELKRILKKLVALPKTLPPVETAGEYEVRELLSDENRHAARAFLVEYLVKKHQHHQLPEAILASNSICHAAYAGCAIKGVCEIQRSGGRWRLWALAVEHDKDSGKISRTLLRDSLQKAFEEKNAHAVLVAAESQAGKALKSFGLQMPDQGEISVHKKELAQLALFQF